MKSERWIRARAKSLYQSDGSIEIDENARVSRGGETGAYVEAWVWVPMEPDSALQRRPSRKPGDANSRLPGRSRRCNR